MANHKTTLLWALNITGLPAKPVGDHSAETAPQINALKIFCRGSTNRQTGVNRTLNGRPAVRSEVDWFSPELSGRETHFNKRDLEMRHEIAKSLIERTPLKLKVFYDVIKHYLLECMSRLLLFGCIAA